MPEVTIDEGIQKIGLPLFILSLLTTTLATGISLYTIFLHLKNYRRPDLQRLTIRILLMHVFVVCICCVLMVYVSITSWLIP